MNYLTKDIHTSLGIAAGYLNLTASLLGYRTGCCQCMNAEKVQEVALLEDIPLLLMGVGYHQEGVNRRQHHIRDDFLFNSKKKMVLRTYLKLRFAEIVDGMTWKQRSNFSKKN